MNQAAVQPLRRKHSVVVIDDDAATVELVGDILDSDDVAVTGVTDWESGLQLVQNQRPQVVVLDLMLPGVSGMQMLERILQIDSGTDVILLTGSYSTDSAVEAIQRGACDYLTKPVSPGRLAQRVGRCFAERRARTEAMQIDAALVGASRFEGIVGRSPLMLDLFSKIKRIAPHFQTVLVTGESGTGKELVASALHNLSPGAANPLVVCNCAAIPESVFESELFGHVKGAFTGAVQDRIGLAEHAQNGTLFLDEVGEMPLTTQAKLLRLIQNREIQRIGSPVPRKVNLRIVAATHQNLTTMVTEKQFRQDLYYRLTSIQLHVPALLHRREDLALLQHHFLRKYSEEYGKAGLHFSRRVESALALHSWPGNVRELENAIAHACLMAEGDTIEVRHLPESVRSPKQEFQQGTLVSLRKAQQQHVQTVLKYTGGNILQASKILGISRATLYRMLPAAHTAVG